MVLYVRDPVTGKFIGITTWFKMTTAKSDYITY